MIQIVCILILLVAMTIFTQPLMKLCSPRQSKWLIWSLFIFYLFGNLYFTLLSRELSSGQYLELMPFRVYGHLFELQPVIEEAATGFAAKFLQETLPITGLILNILLYYPLGYLLPVLFPKLKPKHIILIGCLCSVATEATQYLLKMGWCETDDVIHNSLGTAIGVWVWLWQSKRLNAQRSVNPGKGET